jgi:hypothetical protein
MMWLALPVIAAALVAGLTLYRRRPTEPQCPACRVDYEIVSAAGQGPNASYDVLACPFCANTTTRVHGARSAVAWCPACRSRSLQTRGVRLAGEPLQVEMHEHCTECEYERDYVVGEGGLDRPLGKVIPFPVERARQRRLSRGEDSEQGGNVHTL